MKNAFLFLLTAVAILTSNVALAKLNPEHLEKGITILESSFLGKRTSIYSEAGDQMRDEFNKFITQASASQDDIAADNLIRTKVGRALQDFFYIDQQAAYKTLIEVRDQLKAE